MNTPTHRTGTVRSGDVTLFYRHFGKPGATPILITHGANYYDSHDWIDVAQALSADREVVAYDTRGFGESSWSASKNYAQDAQMGDMIALLEGLAYGLAIIATRVGAVPEVITDQHEGLLVPSHSPARLAEAMCALATDRPRRKTMASAARQLASTRFSIDRFRDDLISLYDDVSGRALQHTAEGGLGPRGDAPYDAHPTHPLQ